MKVVLEFENETLANNIIKRLRQWGYNVELNRYGDVLGIPTKEYKVRN